MHKTFKKIIVFLVMALLMTILVSNYSLLLVRAESKQLNLSSTLTESISTYSSATDDSVTTMKNGKKGLTSLSISGDILSKSTKDKVMAYGVKGGVVSFNISYDGSLLDDSNPDSWHIISDERSNVDGFQLGGSVDKGCLLILKKRRGGEYELATNPITNFTYSKDNIYTTRGEDVYEGTYYKIIYAYSSRIRIKEGFLGIGKKYDTYYHMESYEFYLCEDSGAISLNDLSVGDEYFENEDLTFICAKREIISAGITSIKYGSKP